MRAMLACVLLLGLSLASCQSQNSLQVEADPTATNETVATRQVPEPTSTATEIPATEAVPSATSEPNQVVDLQLELADSNWDGDRIPEGQQCLREGSENPSTPAMFVRNIPEGVDAIILEFSDRDFRPMDNGGHGQFGFMIPEGTGEAMIPSIPGNTLELPEDFFLVQEHRAVGVGPVGAYMPPCSGGTNHAYYVTVKAVALISLEEKTFTVLGQGVLELGEY
jgi:hypothetical protein